MPKKEIDSLFNEWDKVTSSAYIHCTRHTLYRLPPHHLSNCYACLLLSQGGDGAIGYKELSKILKKTQTELAKREKEKK